MPRHRYRFSLSRKILLTILPLFLLFVGVSVTLQNHFQEKEMVDQAQSSAYTHADLIRESLVSMMVNNLEVDTAFLDRVNRLPQLDTLRILVNDLRIREELLTPERIERMRAKKGSRLFLDSLEARVLASGTPQFRREGNEFRGVIPYNATKVCQKCHAVPVGYTLGASDLRLSFGRIAMAARDNWRRSLLIFLIFTTTVAAVAWWLFRRLVSRPVDGLVAATGRISRGDLETPVAAGDREDARDELALLAVRFDSMRLALREKIGELDKANRELSDRNADVERALEQLRRAQEELVRSERLAVMGRMTAQLSHEINNPIHNIQSLLESSLRKIHTEDPSRELLTVARDEVERLARLTRQMLHLYRGSVVPMEQEPVSIQSLVGEIEATFADSLARDGILLETRVEPALPSLTGSRDKLKQVLINLVLNARDAQPQGGRIAVTAGRDANNVVIRVSDAGQGIAPEHIDRVFDPFFTTKKEVSGVGLGLAVSYGIVQQHNGTITVKSEPGKGATFSIVLPGGQTDA